MKWFTVALIASLAATTYGLPPEVQKALRPTNPLTITEQNRDEIWNLRPGPKQLTPGYVILDLPYVKLQSDMVVVLRDYVRSGHGILLTTQNGCNACFADVIGVVATGDGSTYRFSASDSMPLHPVLTSTKIVEVLEADQRRDYNGQPQGFLWDHTLLTTTQSDKGTPLLIGPLMGDKKTPTFGAICYEYGSGRILLFGTRLHKLPLSQNASRLDIYDNHRFAVNLDQWLAGFPVPGAAAQSAGPGGTTGGSRARDTIVLKNGDVVTGDIQDDTFTIKTSYAEVTFKRQEVTRITLEGGGANMDALVLAVGDRLSGVLQNPQLTIMLQGGGKVDIARDKIKEVVVYPRQ
jgi:hypothetical protein